MYFPLSVCFLSLLLSLCTIPRAHAQGSFVSHDRPQLYYLLGWDKSAATWDSLNRVYATYDVNGRETSKETFSWNTNTWAWVPVLRQETRYVGQQDSTIMTQLTWNGVNWAPNSRNVLAKDPLGRINYQLNMAFGSSVWDTLGGTRFTYLDDLSGRLEYALIEDYNGFANRWDTSQLTNYLYGAQTTPESATYDNYVNGFWHPAARDIAMQWHSFPKFKASHYLRQIWNGTSYGNSLQTDCIYGPYEFRRCTTDRWLANAWEPYERDKNLHDGPGHLTENGYEQYDSNAWNLGYWYRYTHTYIGGKISETLVDYWSTPSQSLERFQKYVFFDYALESPAPAQGQPVIAFPVPAHNRLYVQADLRGPVQVSLRDVQGRLLLEERSDAMRLSGDGVDVSALPNGLYLLSLQAGGRAHTVRVQVLR